MENSISKEKQLQTLQNMAIYKLTIQNNYIFIYRFYVHKINIRKIIRVIKLISLDLLLIH